MWLFLKMPRVGLQCVIVVYPDHTHEYVALLFVFISSSIEKNTDMNDTNLCIHVS